jgi:hypothetical protein
MISLSARPAVLYWPKVVAHLMPLLWCMLSAVHGVVQASVFEHQVRVPVLEWRSDNFVKRGTLE